MRLMSHNIINESDAELFILYLGGNCDSTISTRYARRVSCLVPAVYHSRADNLYS